MTAMTACPPPCPHPPLPPAAATVLEDLQLRALALAPAFELLEQRHPDAVWRRAAGTAGAMLRMKTDRYSLWA